MKKLSRHLHELVEMCPQEVVHAFGNKWRLLGDISKLAGVIKVELRYPIKKIWLSDIVRSCDQIAIVGVPRRACDNPRIENYCGADMETTNLTHCMHCDMIEACFRYQAALRFARYEPERIEHKSVPELLVETWYLPSVANCYATRLKITVKDTGKVLVDDFLATGMAMGEANATIAEYLERKGDNEICRKGGENESYNCR